MHFNVDDYLKRINYNGSLDVSLETLNLIHKCHLYNIPFENLDVINNTPIILTHEHLFEKIVTNKRGGFCYELNGLFYYLLQALGFYVTRIAVRVFNDDGIPGQNFGHLALIVKLQNDYLVDVGFGDNFILPLQITNDIIQKDETGYYCIQQYDQKHYILKRSTDKISFDKKYTFTTSARKFEEFTEACHYTSNSPKSHFTQKKIVSLPTKYGRLTLNNEKFIETINGNQKETTINNDKEFLTFLKEKFHINFDY